jgi:hypothetical protein
VYVPTAPCETPSTITSAMIDILNSINTIPIDPLYVPINTLKIVDVFGYTSLFFIKKLNIGLPPHPANYE